MTGEMSKADVTRDAYPIHFAIARALKGTVHPFDVYQGPYICANGMRLWVSSGHGDTAVIYNETSDRQSCPFWPYGRLATRHACKAAREVIA